MRFDEKFLLSSFWLSKGGVQVLNFMVKNSQSTARESLWRFRKIELPDDTKEIWDALRES